MNGKRIGREGRVNLKRDETEHEEKRLFRGS